MRTNGLVLLVGWSSSVVGGASAQADQPSAVAAALGNPARSKDAADDARRHPRELATFPGVKPGDVVVDLIPGGGYCTRIFSLIVGPKGHVYAVGPTEYAKADGDELPLVQALANDPHFANVTVLMQPAAKLA